MQSLGRFNLIVGILMVLVQAGCGSSENEDPSPSTVGCGEGAAQVGVGDAHLLVLCGCQEEAGTVVLPPATLTCTVPQGTYIFFQYLGTSMSHQIVSNGQPSFEAGPRSQPDNQDIIRTHVVHLTSPGTYPFIDIQNGVLSGQIIVQ